jgi:hypothetical protein
MRKLLVAIVLAGCSGRDVPSCQDSVHHFYSVGCKFVDLNTGSDISEAQFILTCKQLLAEANSSSCRDAVADFRVCLGDVKGNPPTDENCDCSSAQDELLTCRQ